MTITGQRLWAALAAAAVCVAFSAIAASPASAWYTKSQGFNNGVCEGYIQLWNAYSVETELRMEARCNSGGSVAPTYRAMLIGDNNTWHVGDTKTMRWTGARWTSDGLRVFGKHYPTFQIYNFCGLISNPRTGALIGGTCRKIKFYVTWGGLILGHPQWDWV